MLIPATFAVVITVALHRPMSELIPWVLAGLFGGGMLLLCGIHFSQRGRNLVAEARDVESLRALSWRRFEELVRAAYRADGWIAQETEGDADGGADIILRRRRQRWLVQCKQWRERSVGVDKVRELLGVVTANKSTGGILVTCGDFSQDAERFAEKNGIRLVTGKALLRLIGTPVSDERDAISLNVAPARSKPTCPRCGGPTHLIQKPLAESSYFGCNSYPNCWCRIPVETVDQYLQVGA